MTVRQSILGAAVCAGISLSVSWAFADSMPKVDTSMPTPVVYPERDQSSGEQGTVILSVCVDSHGKPVLANVAKTSGYPDLDIAAVETVMNWHYLPAIHGGDVAKDWASVQVVYRLPGTSEK